MIDTSLVSGLNLFSYCNNNPVNSSDGTGHFPISIGIGLLSLAALLLWGIVSTTTIYASDQAKKESSPSYTKVTSNTQVKPKEEKASNYTVYQLVDESNNVQYVGRTKNVVDRKKAHANSASRGELEFQVIKSNLTYEAARGIEQAYMLYYHTIDRSNAMNNQINGISLNNAKIGIFIDNAAAYLENQITNELLCWAGM